MLLAWVVAFEKTQVTAAPLCSVSPSNITLSQLLHPSDANLTAKLAPLLGTSRADLEDYLAWRAGAGAAVIAAQHAELEAASLARRAAALGL